MLEYFEFHKRYLAPLDSNLPFILVDVSGELLVLVVEFCVVVGLLLGIGLVAGVELFQVVQVVRLFRVQGQVDVLRVFNVLVTGLFPQTLELVLRLFTLLRVLHIHSVDHVFQFLYLVLVVLSHFCLFQNELLFQNFEVSSELFVESP